VGYVGLRWRIRTSKMALCVIVSMSLSWFPEAVSL
jgi:hypothetical protein